MNLKFKKLHPDAQIPEQAHKGDAGYDLITIDSPIIKYDDYGEILYIEYKTGLSVQPPNGFRTELYPRSSISKYNLSLCNGLGLIDSSYTGELICRFNLIIDPNSSRPSINPNSFNIYQKGDKIAQLVIKKDYIFPIIEIDELDKTERNDGGFGSTGN